MHQKNLEFTPSLSAAIESKLVKPLEKRLQNFVGKDLPILTLELGRSTRHHHKGNVFYAEGNLSIGKKLLRAEVTDQDIHTACDLLKDELLGEINKLKEKKESVSKKSAREVKNKIKSEY